MPKRKAQNGETADNDTSPTVAKKVRNMVRKNKSGHYSGATNNGPSPVQQNIKKVFDTYRDDATTEPDAIGTEGTMKYLQALNVDLEDTVVMAIFDLLDSPAMAELSRDGFTAGWQSVSNATNPCDTIDRQAAYAKTLQTRLTSDPEYFRQVYKNAFKFAKPLNQRAIPMDDAFAYWDMFFREGHSGIEWNTKTTKWMDLWTEFYKDKVKRPVNKDLWNQVAELVKKTQEPNGETMEWWSEDGAWPTAVDQFVQYVKEQKASEGSMDTS